MECSPVLSKAKMRALIFLTAVLLYGATSQPLKDYEVVYPERISTSKSRRDLSTENYNGHEDEVAFQLSGFGKDYVLELRRNRDFHTPSILVKTYDSSNKGIKHRHKPNNCFYHGKLKNEADSYVLMSTCGGKLRGMFEVNGTTFYLEPQNESHILYTPTDDEEFFMKENQSCAMPDKESIKENQTIQKTIPQRMRRSLASLNAITDFEPQYLPYLTTTDIRYCETFVVVDHKTYQRLDNNTDLVIERVLNSFHSVDRAYSAINIRIVVVGIEIWTQGDKFTRTRNDSVAEYSAFRKYWQSNIKGELTHDIAEFLSYSAWTDGVAGRGGLPGVCTQTNAVGINAFAFNSVTGPTIIIGHEMGHSFNFPHDDAMENCTCLAGARGCFMGGKKTRRPGFTTCNMERLAARPFACINNYPKGPFGHTCGNGIIEEGEQCDCGTVEMCEKMDPCCQPGNCMLKMSAQCSDLNSPACCANCRLKSQGTLCRASMGNCDVDEFCTGSSPFCPADDRLADGTNCSDTKILLKGPEGYRKTSLNVLHPKITARYLKIIPHKNKVSSAPCMTIEILASDAREDLAAVPTPITTRDLYYTASICVTPNITDCSDTSNARLMYKEMPFGKCNLPQMQFTLESDGTLRHMCTKKVVCPDKKRQLFLQDSCDKPGDGKYERTAARSIKHKATGRCFLASGGWPKDRKSISLSHSCDLPSGRGLHDFLIPDSLLPVGMEDGSFPESGFSSNAESKDNQAKNARYRSSSGFCFKTKYHPDAYLKIDLGSTKKIGGIEVTSPSSAAVTAFYVEYSLDGSLWESYSESGIQSEAMNSYCYEGQCVPTLDNQCKDLWDSKTTKADDKCWNMLNGQANGFGTCEEYAPKKCPALDTFCGQIQCSSPKAKPLHISYGASYSSLTLDGAKCSAANITDKHSDEKGSGLGMVLSGTKCGESKICKGNKCIEMASAGYTSCPVINGTTCAGRGVCLSSGKCFCDSGYDPESNCELELVARDGEMGQWSPWSLCTKGCNGGIRMRRRFCDSPYPAHGGRDCEETLLEEETCNSIACPLGYSCRQIQHLLSSKVDQLHDGIYTIKVHDGTTMPVYCDMTRNGGGWTLIFSSNSRLWNNKTVFELNKEKPALYKDYSIINYADAIKDTYLISSARMEYKLEAQERGKWGGIWSAPSEYLFSSTSSSQTDVILEEKFSKWDSESENKNLASRMPYVYGKMVTTAATPGPGSRGTLADDFPTFSTAKWMTGPLQEFKPEHIWYWMREGAVDPPHSCREIKLRGSQMNKVYPDGVYNIQSKTGHLVKTYCDMTRYGGGWTLLVTAQASGGFTSENVKLFNADSPSLSSDYSILGLADDIKGADPTEDKFQYMVEANSKDKCGGIFSAPVSVQLASYDETAQPKLLKQFDLWDLNSTLARHVPHLTKTEGILFSAVHKGDNSGVLIKSAKAKGPYLPGTLENPTIIRFWIREGVTRRSCNDIKVFGTKRGYRYDDGYYTIQHPDPTKPEFVMPVYCDMTSDPGAWTLLVTSRHNNWNATQVFSRNMDQPSLSNDYSILKFADKIRDMSNGNTFKYKLSAQKMNRWGGTFSAPKEYSFISKSNELTGVTLLKQFDDWEYNVWYESVNNRMPWLGNPEHGKGLLTTSGSDNFNWYGTIISGNNQYNPAPWINKNGMKNPGVIWYLINEDDCDESRNTVDGGLSPWSVWSKCSSLCSSGTRRRSRDCYLPKPRCGGAPCQDDIPLAQTQSCQGDCPVSAIKTPDDRYCLLPESGTCQFSSSTRLVWRFGIDKCSLKHAKYVFNVETGAVIHQCSGVAVCPKGGSSDYSTDLVVDPKCPEPSKLKKMIRTHENQLGFDGKCFHPSGGSPRDGRKLVMWRSCLKKRLIMEFFELPKGKVHAKYFFKLNVKVATLDAALYSDPRYPSNPSSSGRLDNLEVPLNVGNIYGVVLSSYFIAPMSGPYHFHTACDDQCDLYLSSSTDANSKERIVRQTKTSPRHSYKTYVFQTSKAVTLVAGQKYYIEVALLENQGSDHLSVAVTLPSGTFVDPITAQYLTYTPL